MIMRVSSMFSCLNLALEKSHALKHEKNLCLANSHADFMGITGPPPAISIAVAEANWIKSAQETVGCACEWVAGANPTSPPCSESVLIFLFKDFILKAIPVSGKQNQNQLYLIFLH